MSWNLITASLCLSPGANEGDALIHPSGKASVQVFRSFLNWVSSPLVLTLESLSCSDTSSLSGGRCVGPSPVCSRPSPVFIRVFHTTALFNFHEEVQFVHFPFRELCSACLVQELFV